MVDDSNRHRRFHEYQLHTREQLRDGNVLEEARRVTSAQLINPAGPEDILDFVRREKCCSLYTFGHQGGNDDNPGGAITQPKENGRIITLFPNTEVHGPLEEAFKDNGCEGKCAINIVACGACSDAHTKNRQQIANETGCLVCGSTEKIDFTERANPQCTLGEPGTYTIRGLDGPEEFVVRRWRNECVAPANRKWKKTRGRCLDGYWTQVPYGQAGNPLTGYYPLLRDVYHCTEWEYRYEPDF